MRPASDIPTTQILEALDMLTVTFVTGVHSAKSLIKALEASVLARDALIKELETQVTRLRSQVRDNEPGEDVIIAKQREVTDNG